MRSVQKGQLVWVDAMKKGLINLVPINTGIGHGNM